MRHPINAIHIQFNVAVEVTTEESRALLSLVSRICNRWEHENPSRVLWPAGQGFMPQWEGGDITGFDETVFSIDCSTRAAYSNEIAGRKDTPPLEFHVGPCGCRVDPTCAWLADGTKIVIKREGNRAWIEVSEQARVAT